MPAWLNDLPEDQRALGRAHFLLKIAALYNSPTKGMRGLSAAIGLDPNTLSAMLHQRQLPSVETCIKVEALLGRDIFPRELMRPDIFLPVGA